MTSGIYVKFCKHTRDLHTAEFKRVARVCQQERLKKQRDEFNRQRKAVLKKLHDSEVAQP